MGKMNDIHKLPFVHNQMLKYFLSLSYQSHEPQMCEYKIQTKESRTSRKRHQKLQSNGEMGPCFVLVKFTQPNDTYIKWTVLFSFHFSEWVFQLEVECRQIQSAFMPIYSICDMCEWERYKRKREQKLEKIEFKPKLNVCMRRLPFFQTISRCWIPFILIGTESVRAGTEK